MTESRSRDSLSARALEFTILTAARTNETIGAEWSEFDVLKARTWKIPGERMKAGKEHRVPLCDRAVDILRGLERHAARVFPLSNMASASTLARHAPRTRSARLPQLVSGLVRRADELPESRRRDGARALHRRQGGEGLPAWRAVREAQAADERMGAVL